MELKHFEILKIFSTRRYSYNIIVNKFIHYCRSLDLKQADEQKIIDANSRVVKRGSGPPPPSPTELINGLLKQG